MANTIEVIIKATDKASVVVSKIEANITTKTTKAASAIDKLTAVGEKAAGGFGKLQAGIVTANQAFDLIGRGIGVVKDVLEQTIGSTIEYAKQVRDLSTNLGITAEETSKLIQVSDDYGISVESLTGALQMAVKRGFAPNVETIAQLADEYQSIQNPVERAARLSEVFGKNWAELTPLLKEGGAAIRDAAEEAKKLGLTLSDEDVKAAREFEIQLDNMGDKLEAVKLKVGKGVVPALNQFFDTLSQGMDVITLTTQGVGGLDEKENQLASTLARTVVLSFGQETDAVRRARDELQQYLSIRQQVGMTEQEAALRTNMAAAAMEEATRATESKTAQDNAATVAAQQHTAIMLEYSNSLLYNVQQYEAQKVAAEQAAAAEAAHRASIADSISANEKLAQSLMKATDAQAIQMLAQSQLDTLREAYEKGVITQQDYNQAIEDVLIQYDLATPKSLAMADAQDAINKAFLESRLPLRDYIASTSKIPTIANDGVIGLDELTTLGIKPTTAAVDEQSTVVNELEQAWSRIPANVKTVYTIETRGEAPATPRAGGGNIPGFQHGADFIVPPSSRGGFGDSFPFFAAPGERVIVQTPAQQGGATNSVVYNYTTNVYNPLAAAMLADQQRRERLARSNARMGVTA